MIITRILWYSFSGGPRKEGTPLPYSVSNIFTPYCSPPWLIHTSHHPLQWRLDPPLTLARFVPAVSIFTVRCPTDCTASAVKWSCSHHNLHNKHKQLLNCNALLLTKSSNNFITSPDIQYFLL